MKRIGAFFMRHKTLYAVLQMLLAAGPALLLLPTLTGLVFGPALWALKLPEALAELLIGLTSASLLVFACGGAPLLMLLSVLLTLCTKPIRDEWPAWKIKLLAFLYVLGITALLLWVIMLIKLHT